MTTQIAQVRLTKTDLAYIDRKVRDGTYSSRSDAMRTMIRLQQFREIYGIGGHAKENSVKAVRKIRDNSPTFDNYEDFRKYLDETLSKLPRFDK